MTSATGGTLLKQHPLSAAFPPMPAVEIEALAMDIEKYGQREPGVRLDGMILDGWHRYLACQKAGIKFNAVEFKGPDPVAFVISRNLHRRHLTASQRAAAVVATTKWRTPGNPEPGSGLTEAQMAEAADVSDRTIRQAKAAHEAGLGDKVLSGEISAKEGARVAKLPKAKREKALKEGAPNEKKPDIKDYVKRSEFDDLQERYETVAETARELEDKLTAYEKTTPDEQQKEIMRLQKALQKADGEIERLTRARNDAQAKCNELIREVKKLRKRG